MPRPFGRIAQRFIDEQDQARRLDMLRDFDRFCRLQRLRFNGKLAGSERRIQQAREKSYGVPESWQGDEWELLESRKR